MHEDTRASSADSGPARPSRDINEKPATKPDGFAVLDCPSETARQRMTSGWTPDDWYECLLDVGLSYEDELRAISVRTPAALLAYPLGCLLGLMVSWGLWGRNLGLYLPLVGKASSEVSSLCFFAATTLSCSLEPLALLVGYSKPTFSDGFFAAYYPAMLYACTTLRTVPLASVLAVASTAIALVRILLTVARALSEGAEDPMPSIVFGFRSQLRTLAVVLQLIMLLSVLGVIPVGRAAAQRVGADAQHRVARIAGDDRPLESDDLQDVLDGLQMAVSVQAQELGIEDAPRVMVTLIPDQSTAAYRRVDNTIIINSLGLDSGRWPPRRSTLLFLAFHELFHCYQHQLVGKKAPLLDDGVIDLDEETVSRFAREFAMYPILSATPSGYYALEVEETANVWAKATLDRYRDEYKTWVTQEPARPTPTATCVTQ